MPPHPPTTTRSPVVSPSRPCPPAAPYEVPPLRWPSRPAAPPSPRMRRRTTDERQGDPLGPHRGVRSHVPDDVQEGGHRAVPLREAADRPAVPRPAPAQPLARRAGEVHRLRAVRLG